EHNGSRVLVMGFGRLLTRWWFFDRSGIRPPAGARRSGLQPEVLAFPVHIHGIGEYVVAVGVAEPAVCLSDHGLEDTVPYERVVAGVTVVREIAVDALGIAGAPRLVVYRAQDRVADDVVLEEVAFRVVTVGRFAAHVDVGSVAVEDVVFDDRAVGIGPE